MATLTMAPVKERPILFSAPMVQAILAGRKTQTRRILKPWWEIPEALEWLPEQGHVSLPEAIAAYNLAQQMASAPGSIYGAYMSPSTYWMLLESTANTYGNSQPFMDTANSGTGADFSYQAASVQRYGPLPEYGTLTFEGQQQIAATGATTDVNDAVASSSLTTLGTMRANEIQREADIENLEAESQTMDPTQQTDLATEQRINQAALLQIRQQQESNQLQQDIALQQMVANKQQQDVIKAKFQDADGYGVNFQTNVAPAYGGGSQAMTY